jgi:hypothetical protein
MGVETFAQFSGELAHASIHTVDKNWNSMIVVRRRAEKRRHQREIEKLALKIESGLILPAFPDRSHGKDPLAHFLHRSFPLDAEATLVMTFYLGAEAKNEATRPKTRRTRKPID